MKKGLRRIACLAAGTAILLTSGAVRAADDGEARDLMKRVLDAVPTVPFTASAKLTSDRGWLRELTLSHKHLTKDLDVAYMEVTSPMDLKDTRFLLLDRLVGRDEQFIYVPSIKRTIQVSTETRKQPFLGSDFYVYDLVRPEFDAYSYSFVGEEEIAGHHCKLVQSVPKNAADDLYSKTIVAIDPTDLLVWRTQFFDQSGKLFKVWTLEKAEKIDGNWTPLLQKMVNVQDKHESQLELVGVKYNAQLPDEMFERSYLSH
jgi:outer membrane lipoprotein-sorting protein